MSIRLCLCLVLAGLLSLCCAQAPTRAHELTQRLFQQAKAAMSAVPAAARAADLVAIAEAEQEHHPKTARADLQAAFAEAVALPAGSWQRHVKRYVELSVITALASQPDSFALARQLARQADIRRAWTYNELIAASATRAWLGAHPAGVPQVNLLNTDAIGSLGFVPSVLPPHVGRLLPPGDIAAMARECARADGSFPYRGVVAALRSYRLTTAQRQALLHAGYAAAGNETDARALPQAVALLRTGHALAPALDLQMQAAAQRILPHLQAALRTAESAPGDRRSRQLAAESALALELSGSRVLQLVNSTDAASAASLRARYAEFPPRASAHAAIRFHPQPGPDNPAAALAQAEALPQRTQREQQLKFFALLRLALLHQPGNPAVARASSDVLQRMNPTLLEPALPLAARLALLMQVQRHQPEQADRLIRNCLDALEAEAVQRQHRFGRSPARFQAALAFLFETSGWPVRLFSIAAQLDPTLAQQRAEQTQATFFKPLFLAEVASGLEGQTQ